MECQRYDHKHIFLAKLVVSFEVVVECFFVADEVVELKMVVHHFLGFVLLAGLQVVRLKVF